MLYNRLHQSRTIHVQRREREKTSTRSCVQLVEGNSVPQSNYFQFSPNTSLKLRSFTHERKFALRQAFTIFVSVAVLIQAKSSTLRKASNQVPLMQSSIINHLSFNSDISFVVQFISFLAPDMIHVCGLNLKCSARQNFSNVCPNWKSYL